MTERKRETDSAVVFQTAEGTFVWSPLGSGIEAEKMIKEKESQGYRVFIITSSLDAKKMVREQTDYKKEINFLKRS